MPNTFETGGDNTGNQPPVDLTQLTGADAVAQPGLTLLSQGDQYDGILSLMQASLQNQQLPQDNAFLSDLQIVENSAGFTPPAASDTTSAAGQLQATKDVAVNQALDMLSQAMQANPQAIQDNNVMSDLQLITGAGDGTTSGLQAAADSAVNQALGALQDAVQKDPDILNDPAFAADLQTIVQNAQKALQPAADNTAQSGAPQDASAFAGGSGNPGTDYAAGNPGAAATPGTDYAAGNPGATSDAAGSPQMDSGASTDIPPQTDQTPSTGTSAVADTGQPSDDPAALLSQLGIDPTQDAGANEGLIQLLKGNEVAGITALMKAVQADPGLLQNATFLKSLKTVETTLAAQKAAPAPPAPAKA